MIGRDHLDAGSVASPYRETEAMADGSDAIADWPLLNALLNTASGASWVSIHHGGGVGIGRSIHAGQVTVADGTALAAEKLERVLTNDPGTGVMRHVDAGYDRAKEVARERGLQGADARRMTRTSRAARRMLITAASRARCVDATMRSTRPRGRGARHRGCDGRGAHRGRTHHSRYGRRPRAPPITVAGADRARRIARRPSERPHARSADVEVVDAGGRAVIPGFVDSHTHLVFGGDRADEFEARMSGTPYAAGGIRRTVAATRAATDDELRARLAGFVAELRAQGTTTFEVKTGYGLTVHDEARLARLAAEVTPEVTFLGAHVVPGGVPESTDGGDYVDLVCGEMLAACAPHSRWIDVFCERGAFDARRASACSTAGSRRRPLRCACTATSSAPAKACGSRWRWARHPSITARTSTTRMSPPSPARTPWRRCCRASSSRRASRIPTLGACIDAGVTVALASDCNPGSSFTSSMPLMIALAVREMGMTTAEAVWAATAGGARRCGATTSGHRARQARGSRAARRADPHPPGLPPGGAARRAVWKDGVEVV